MKEIKGIYTSAKIFTDSIDQYALAQIQMICDLESAKGSRICVMPDVHPGKVGPIGLTMTFRERVLPALVGIDIGCGMTCAILDRQKIEYQKLDTIIREQIPGGMSIRRTPLRRGMDFPYEMLECAEHIQLEKAMCSIGTLGGGNHFIEIDRSEGGTLYLTIHSGSRRLGKEVAEYYLKLGQKELKSRGLSIPHPLIWLDGEYLLRKGAISARKGEKLVIPVNMRDGILLAAGKGNPEWNCSAPHGSGRLLKREDVSKCHTVSQFKAQMKGIHCTCIGKETLDESPFAYRDMDEILGQISETAEIQNILRPVYNYKAGNR